jgi:MFS family permease
MFLVARVLWGVCWSFLRLGGYLAALESSDQQSRGYYLGFFNGAARIGTLTAVLFGGILTDQIGFRSTVFLFAAITLVGGLAILREQPTPQPVGADSRVAHTTPRALRDQPIESPNGPPNGYASRSRRWVVYGAAFVNGSAGSNLIVATLGLWLLELYGPMIQIANLTLGVASLTGLLLATRFLADVVLAPAAGHLSDRYGRVWFIITAGTVTVSTLAGLSIRAGLAWTMVMAVCVFLSGTALHAALDAAAGDLAPPSGRSRVMSWYANWSDLGAATGPLVAYQLGVGLGLEWVYRGGAACLTLAGLASLALSRETQDKDVPSGRRL